MLADAGLGGCAIAPDRHGIGTNAIALAPGHIFRFAFGAASLGAHRAQGSHVLVDREGLMFDLDTPGDLAALRTRRLTHPRPTPHTARSADRKIGSEEGGKPFGAIETNAQTAKA